MKEVRIPHKKVLGVIRSWKKNRIPFVYRVTNQSVSISSKHGSYRNRESQFPVNELTFIRSVKDRIIKDGLYQNFPPARDRKRFHQSIVYFKYNRKLLREGSAFNDCVEIDLKAAYWNTAYQIGLLPKDLFEKGNFVSKMSRLAALGSLAKKTTVIEFDGKKEIRRPEICSPLTEHLWDIICKQVGDHMNEVSSSIGDAFMFFWVDAMFCKKSAAGAVKKAFRRLGYEFSQEPVRSITIQPNTIIVEGKERKQMVDGDLVTTNLRYFPFLAKKRGK